MEHITGYSYHLFIWQFYAWPLFSWKTFHKQTNCVGRSENIFPESGQLVNNTFRTVLQEWKKIGRIQTPFSIINSGEQTGLDVPYKFNKMINSIRLEEQSQQCCWINHFWTHTLTADNRFREETLNTQLLPFAMPWKWYTIITR